MKLAPLVLFYGRRSGKQVTRLETTQSEKTLVSSVVCVMWLLMVESALRKTGCLSDLLSSISSRKQFASYGHIEPLSNLIRVPSLCHLLSSPPPASGFGLRL